MNCSWSKWQERQKLHCVTLYEIIQVIITIEWNCELKSLLELSNGTFSFLAVPLKTENQNAVPHYMTEHKAHGIFDQVP